MPRTPSRTLRLPARLTHAAGAALLVTALAACPRGPATDVSPAAGAGGTTAAGAAGSAGARDTIADPTLIPAGFGSLRQDDIAVRIEMGQLVVKAIPLDESVIRTLSPDSYRTLHDIVESHRARLEQVARRRGLNRYDVWYVTFFALQPDVPYQPQEFALVNNGREYRSIDIVPLNAGFGGPRLRQRETQAALYVFDGSVNLQQPVTVQLESGRSDVWQQVIARVERERALIRSRAAQQMPSGVAPNSPAPQRPPWRR